MTRRLAALLALLAICVPANAFIPVSFEVAARAAPTVLLGRCEFGPADHCHLRVVEVVKNNQPTPPVVTVKAIDQFFFRPLENQLYLVVLNEDGEPYDAGSACGTMNILGVGPEYLFMQNYWLTDDYKPMTLEEIKGHILNPDPVQP